MKDCYFLKVFLYKYWIDRAANYAAIFLSPNKEIWDKHV